MLLENLRKSIQIRGLRSAPSENDFMESPTEWYYAVGNEKRGPVSWHQLVQLAATGVLTVDNLIWCEGMNEWQVAELADGLWGEPDWHYAQNGKQLDPVNWVTLRRMAREGTLQLKDLLWHESLPDWIEAARVPRCCRESLNRRPLASAPTPTDDLVPYDDCERLTRSWWLI